MFSCTSLGVKVGGGLGTALSGWLLAASGYDGDLKVQPDSAIQMIYIMYVWLPLAANALILFLLTRLDVEKVNTRLKEEATLGPRWRSAPGRPVGTARPWARPVTPSVPTPTAPLVLSRVRPSRP